MNWINIGTATPDLYFSLVVFYSFFIDVKRNVVTSWFIGISKDLLSEGTLGVNAIFFVAVGFFIWSIRGVLFRGHLVTKILVTFIFSLLYNVLYALHTAISCRSADISSTIWMIFICSSYTAAVTPFLFYLFNKLQPAKNFRSTGE
jgi:rod shape-determining protein MreD